MQPDKSAETNHRWCGVSCTGWKQNSQRFKWGACLHSSSPSVGLISAFFKYSTSFSKRQSSFSTTVVSHSILTCRWLHHTAIFTLYHVKSSFNRGFYMLIKYMFHFRSAASAVDIISWICDSWSTFAARRMCKPILLACAHYIMNLRFMLSIRRSPNVQAHSSRLRHRTIE